MTMPCKSLGKSSPNYFDFRTNRWKYFELQMGIFQGHGDIFVVTTWFHFMTSPLIIVTVE